MPDIRPEKRSPSLQGDIILDPFCGSGTTCLSAVKDGRHYIGYEIDEQYVRMAEQRIDTHCK